MLKRSIEAQRPDEFEKATGYHGWAVKYFADNIDKNIYQRDFEERFSIRRSTATKILQLMEKNGLIERKSVESDARLKKIILTKKGLDIHKAALLNLENFEGKLINGISNEELSAFFETIDKIKKNLEE